MIRSYAIDGECFIRNSDVVAWLRREALEATINGWDAHAPSEVIAKLADALEREGRRISGSD